MYKRITSLCAFICLVQVSTVFAIQKTASELPVTPPPRWAIPKMQSAPVIDGKINAQEWSQSASVTGFQLFPLYGRGFCPIQTHTYMGWDNKYLYFGFRTRSTHRDMILVNQRGRDAAAYMDESYSIGIWPEGRDDYFQFIIGLASLYDARKLNKTWDSPGIKHKASQQNGYFDAELAIPWKDLNLVPRPGMMLKTVLATSDLETGFLMSNWQYVGPRYDYHEKKYAGELILAEGSPVVRMLDWGEVNKGLAAPILEILNPASQAAKVSCKIYAGYGSGEIDSRFYFSEEVNIPAGKVQKIEPRWSNLTSEIRFVGVKVLDDGKTLASLEFPHKIDPTAILDIECFPSRKRLDITVDAIKVQTIGQVASVKLTVDQDSKVLTSETKPLDEKCRAKFSVDFAKIPLGKYRLLAECFDRKGNLLNSRVQSWENLDPNPAWLKNPIAAELRVTKGFQPVSLKKDGKGAIEVGIWGRKYVFNDSLYPVSIISQGRQLLNAPAQLVGNVGGKALKFSPAHLTVTENSAARVILESLSIANDVEFSTKTSIEFDGMLLSTLKITPRRKGVVIDRLAFELPFNRQAASLLHRNSCGVNHWSGKTPEVQSWPYYPVVWLGNEYAGLCWFAEQNPGISNMSWGNVLQIRSTGKQTRFVVNMVDKPLNLDKPAEITFGWTATPTKPMPEGWLCKHNVNYYNLGWDESNQFLHEAIPWEKWHAEVDRAHKKGERFVKYTQTNYCSFYGDNSEKVRKAKAAKNLLAGQYFNTPEKKYWRAEWEVWPRPYAHASDGISFCTNSAWKDLVVAGLKERMEKGKVDGIYFDCSSPKKCSNKLHGCKGGWDILGQREIRRRLYNIFDGLDKEPLIWEHIHGNMFGPVMNFSTLHLDGEQFSSGVADFRTVLSLARMRAVSIGTNWGHAPRFMGFCRGSDNATNSLLAIWMLHMPWHNVVAGARSKTSLKADKIEDQFGYTKQTKRLGYWENQDVIQGQSETLKATVYYKPGSMLMVVSNLGDEDISGEVMLNTAKIGLPANNLKIAAVLGNQKEKPALKNGKLTFAAKSNSCVLLILSEQSVAGSGSK